MQRNYFRNFVKFDRIFKRFIIDFTQLAKGNP